MPTSPTRGRRRIVDCPYLNHELPSTDATVAFIPFAAIRLLRVVVERAETSYRDSEAPWVTNSAVETQQWVEFHSAAARCLLGRAASSRHVVCSSEEEVTHDNTGDDVQGGAG